MVTRSSLTVFCFDRGISNVVLVLSNEYNQSSLTAVEAWFCAQGPSCGGVTFDPKTNEYQARAACILGFKDTHETSWRHKATIPPTPAQAPAPARTATAGPAGATEADSTAGSGADVEGAAVRGDRYHAWRGTELSIRPGRGSCPKVSITVHFEVIQKSLVILPVVEHDYPDRDVRGAAGNRNWRCPSLRLSRGLFWVGGSICGVLILIS